MKWVLSVLSLALLGACHPDLCDGINQACLSVRLEAADDSATAMSDRLRVFVSQNGGPASERLTTPAGMQPAGLPIAFSVLLGGGGAVDLDVVAELASMPVLRGQGRETVAAGEHRKLTIKMSAGDGSRPAETPPARVNAGFAYFPERQVVVLFGGQTTATGGQLLGDTWEYQPLVGRWRRILVKSAPEPRTARLTYDPRRRALVLFGGSVAGNRAQNDTWVYGSDGTWSALQLLVSPPPRSAPALAYDYFRDAVELYGGKDLQTGQPLFDLWELPLSASAWSPRGVNGAIPVVSAPQLIFDGRNTLLVGSDETAQTPIKVFRVDVGAYFDLVPPTSMPPSRRSDFAAALDRGSGSLIVFGGSAAGAPLNETWSFSPTSFEWTAIPPSGPAARGHALLEFVPERSGLLLFGGQLTDLSLSVERWLLQGSAWQSVP